MDWSKAKSLLIIAFLAVNIFLASQLIKAKGEQTQNQEVSQVTQLQLEELIADRNIRIPDNLPQKAFPVTYLEAEPTKPESLLEQSDQWEPVEEGRYRIRFQPPLATGKELESILERYVPDFQTYREWRRPNPDEKVYYQHLDHRPIFDDRLIVRLENGNIKELELLPVDVRVDQDNKTQTGLSAQDALVKLVGNRKDQKRFHCNRCHAGLPWPIL